MLNLKFLHYRNAFYLFLLKYDRPQINSNIRPRNANRLYYYSYNMYEKVCRISFVMMVVTVLRFIYIRNKYKILRVFKADWAGDYCRISKVMYVG